MAEILDLPITGTGAVSPVGLGAPATCAALRAGVARLGPVFTLLVDGELIAGEPAVGGRVPLEWFGDGPVDWDWVGHRRFAVTEPPPPESWIEGGPGRLADLARPAAREAWTAAGLGDREAAWGLYLGLDGADSPDPLARAIADAVGSRPAAVHGARSGRAAALLALRQAAKDLRAGTVEAALVGGVDSRLRPEAMAAQRDAGTLRSASRPQGVLPGEAAGFLVLERSVPSGRAAAARLRAVVSDDEPTAGTEEPNVARGLTRTLRKARLGAPPFAARPLAVCDLNGDRYRAMEWGMASMRAFADLPGAVHLWHPADCIGDAGAGLGGLNLVWAAVALAKGYSPTDPVLVWGASDGPERAAAVLSPAGS